MTDRPALALPPEMAQQIAMQAKQERLGRQLLESLACAIYCQLAARDIKECPVVHRESRLPMLLQDDARQALEAALPMAAQLGYHFQAAPVEPDRLAPEHAT